MEKNTTRTKEDIEAIIVNIDNTIDMYIIRHQKKKFKSYTAYVTLFLIYVSVIFICVRKYYGV